MTPVAYYNEFDPYAAQWLRNLIDAGHIAWGIVDERSIEDVVPNDLEGFTQCHFFAGIGVWSLALRQAGWPDGRPVWTGSCPCQPFSAAGKGDGFADERHLWPAFNHLIAQRRPPTVFGEQVASKDADAWVNLVQVDVEAVGYSFGAVPFPAASVGAPHIRDRLYWVAHTNDGGERLVRDCGSSVAARGSDEPSLGPWWGGTARGLAHAGGEGSQEQRRQRNEPTRSSETDMDGGLEHPQGGGWTGQSIRTAKRGQEIGATQGGDVAGPGPTNGPWRDADWLLCRDGKWRPVEPGTFPLAHGAPSRVGRLRAYGNGLCAPAAETFIRAYLEA